MKIKKIPYIGEIDTQEILQTVRAIRSVFSKPKTFKRYFSVIGGSHVDHVIYQLGLRPTIPLMDLLYLEFLNGFLLEKRAKKLFIYPSADLSYPSQDKPEYEEFKTNVLRVLSSQKNKVCFMDPSLLQSHTQDLVSKEFLQAVRYIGSRQFIAFLRDVINWTGNSVSDFNKFHPEDMRLLTVYVHLLRGWSIRQYLLESGIFDKPVNLGFLMWETEVDKLGVFQWMAQHIPMMTITPILCRSITSQKNTPIPVFEPEKTIYIFDDMEKTLLKLANKQDREIKVYIEILSTIMAENYTNDFNHKVACKDGQALFRQQQIMSTELANKKLTRKGYIALYLTHKLRDKYGAQ